MEFVHKSVLLKESVEWLITDPDGIYVDCTMGGAGHSWHFAQQLSARGTLIGIDQDADAIAASTEKLKGLNCQLHIVRANFKDFKEVLASLNIDKITGIFFDFAHCIKSATIKKYPENPIVSIMPSS